MLKKHIILKRAILSIGLLVVMVHIHVSSDSTGMTSVSGSNVIKTSNPLMAKFELWWIGGPAYERSKMTEKNLKLAQSGSKISAQQAKVQNKIINGQADIASINLNIETINDQVKTLNTEKSDLDSKISQLTTLINAGQKPTDGQWAGKSIPSLQKTLTKANDSVITWNENMADLVKKIAKQQQLLSKKTLALAKLTNGLAKLNSQLASIQQQIAVNVNLLNTADPDSATTSTQNMQSLAVAGMATGSSASIVSMPITTK